MNAAAFRRAITESAAYAARNSPTNLDMRLSAFVATLSGGLHYHDPALGEIVWNLFGIPREESPSTPPKAP
jgi:hypothetical protein